MCVWLSFLVHIFIVGEKAHCIQKCVRITKPFGNDTRAGSTVFHCECACGPLWHQLLPTVYPVYFLLPFIFVPIHLVWFHVFWYVLYGWRLYISLSFPTVFRVQKRCSAKDSWTWLSNKLHHQDKRKVRRWVTWRASLEPCNCLCQHPISIPRAHNCHSSSLPVLCLKFGELWDLVSQRYLQDFL